MKPQSEPNDISDDEDDRHKLISYSSWWGDFFHVTSVSQGGKVEYEVKRREYIEGRLPRHLDVFSRLLEKNRGAWIAGTERPTYADFSLGELLDQSLLFHPRCLDSPKYQPLRTFALRFGQLPAIAAYRKSKIFQANAGHTQSYSPTLSPRLPLPLLSSPPVPSSALYSAPLPFLPPITSPSLLIPSPPLLCPPLPTLGEPPPLVTLRRNLFIKGSPISTAAGWTTPCTRRLMRRHISLSPLILSSLPSLPLPRSLFTPPILNPAFLPLSLLLREPSTLLHPFPSPPFSTRSPLPRSSFQLAWCRWQCSNSPAHAHPVAICSSFW